MSKSNTIVNSTLDKKSEAKLVKTIPVDDLVKQYQKQFKIDVSKYFLDVDEIGIYKCEYTSYRFYHPYGIEGDSDFYCRLQEFDWYYMPWKWEHEKVKGLLKRDEKILEVGSGGYGFVEKMHLNKFDVSGLELNKDSVTKAKKKGLKAFDETIQDYTKLNIGKFDVVCSFQVLEHIYDVNSFIKAQVDCLKVGGKLIISVPNNDSFIRLTQNFVLNSPPHHMGLWNKKSLLSLEKIFDLKVEKLEYEPLQEYHIKSYVDLMIQERMNNNKLLSVLFSKMRIRKLYIYLVNKFRNHIKGHSMLICFVKV